VAAARRLIKPTTRMLAPDRNTAWEWYAGNELYWGTEENQA
jgi:hypothetical protein